MYSMTGKIRIVKSYTNEYPKLKDKSNLENLNKKKMGAPHET